MPVARASRTIAAPPAQLWGIVSDPYHLPRWWPRVTRVEDVADGAFTEVMRTRDGKTVRADFDLVRAEEGSGTVVWEQRLDGTPFAAVLASSETELRVDPPPAAAGESPRSEVTIELRQELSGRSVRAYPLRRPVPSLGGWLVRRAAARTIEQALSGLEQISA